MNTFALPPVGEGLLEVELVRWLVQPGDTVVPGQGLAEVMSDKATMEVPAPFAGRIVQLDATPGQKVQVGQRLLTYEPLATPAAPATPAPPDAARPTTATPVPGPTPAASPPAAPGTSPPPATVPSPPMVNVAGNGPTTPTSSPIPPPTSSTAPSGGNGPSTPAGVATLPPAAPSIRLLARQLGIDLRRVRGSGPGGRILLDDLKPFLAPPAGPRTQTQASQDVTMFDVGVPGTRRPLTGLRRRIAEHMVAAKRHIPHYSYMDECDVTELVRLREQLKGPLAQQGIRLTYLPFFIKAVVAALREIPIVNSTYDEEAGEVVLHDRYHIGVAVATPAGLIVPVIHDADRKDIPTLAAEIERLSQAARAQRIRPDDLRGGTFTITSIGNLGGLIATPIINHPQVGIMAIGKIVRRPVYDEHGRIRPADIVYLSFSFDHRIIDGAVGTLFGNAIIRRLQSPAALLLPATSAATPTLRSPAAAPETAKRPAPETAH